MYYTNNEDIKKLIDFWYKFDDYFAFSASAITKNHIKNIRITYKITDQFRRNYEEKTINSTLSGILRNNSDVSESIKYLMVNQLKIIKEELKNDSDTERIAFEYFAQGLLFDDYRDGNGNFRRKPSTRIHRMDEGKYGYITWHAVVRCASLIEIDSMDPELLLDFDRNIVLAALLDNLQKPKPSTIFGEPPNPPNMPLSETKLEEMEESVLSMDFDELDRIIFGIQ